MIEYWNDSLTVVVEEAGCCEQVTAMAVLPVMVLVDGLEKEDVMAAGQAENETENEDRALISEQETVRS